MKEETSLQAQLQSQNIENKGNQAHQHTQQGYRVVSANPPLIHHDESFY